MKQWREARGEWLELDVGLWRDMTARVLLYWIAELFCFSLTPNVLCCLGKLLACCLPRRTWVMHHIFFSCLLVFPVAVAWVRVPGWGMPLWAVILYALLPAPSHGGQVLSRPLALIQHRRTDHAELSRVCCKATPASSFAQPEPFSVGNWRNFHVIHSVQYCIKAGTKTR